MPIRPIIRPSKIYVLSEFASKESDLSQQPLASPAEKEFIKILSDVGISEVDCSFSSVLLERPPSDKLENHYVNKATAGYNYPPPLAMGKYLKPSLLHNRERVYEEIALAKPNLIVCLGNLASWAILDKSGVGSLRGTILASNCGKTMATYSPVSFQAQWELRHTVVMDMFKAKREMNHPEIVYDEVKVWLNPSLQDMAEFYKLAQTKAAISYDIETFPNQKQIRCVGFGIGGLSIVVPFLDKRKPDYNYWQNLGDEIQAWNFVRAMLALPCAKITQNGMYDMTWLWKIIGMTPAGSCEDTMLFHHSLYPEMVKGLDFLGSIYCNLPPWKTLHRRGEFNKKDD